MTADLAPSDTGPVAWLRRNGVDLAVGLVIVAIGVAMRRWILRGALGDADLDEATVGIQAIRFQHGQWATFFPNQPYGGTFETFLVSISQRPFGNTVLALKLVPILCSLGAAVVTWRAAIRLGLSRAGEWCAPLLVWCGPTFAVAFSTKERGFYGVALLLSASYILLVLRIDADPQPADLIGLGALVGLGWWQTPLTMLVAVPAVGWMVFRRQSLVRAAAVPAAALALGALPWLIWNARHRWVSMNGGYSFGTSWWQRVEAWLVKLRVVVGIETPFVPARHLLGGRWTGAVVVAAIVVAASYRTRRRAPGLLATLVVGYGVLYALNGLAAGVGNDPRYTYLLVPAMALAVASLLPELDSNPGDLALIGAVGGLVVALSVWGLVGMDQSARRPGADKFVASPGIEEVARYLERNHRTTAITDIAGMQLTYLTEGRVIATSFAVPRYRDLELPGRAARRSTYVLDDDYLANAGRLRIYLEAQRIDYRARKIGKWWVFLVDRRVLPEDVPLVALDFRPTKKPKP